jgi:2-enoate reductase
MKLFEPGRIGTLTIRNRIMMAPMHIGGLVEPDGRMSQRGMDYFIARAKGGTGLIVTSAHRITRRNEYEPIVPLGRHLMLDSIIYVSHLNELADTVHDYGGKIAAQLTAGLGRVASAKQLETCGAVAPSPLPCFYDPKMTARELATEEVEELVKAFGVAAGHLKSAGIDAAHLHGHEGYLFDQFKTSLWNKRTDKYGGDLDGRLRFTLEVIEAIKKAAGPDFPVIYRFGLTHYLPGGREIPEGLEIARRLEAAGVDALDIDAGSYETWYWAHPPTTQPEGCMVDMAAKAKEVVKIPVIAVGKLGNPDLAERVLQEGKADFVMLGRPLIADPEWPNKVKEGRPEDVCPCIGDHECLKRIMERKYLSCTVNPTTGKEKEFALTPAERKKSVLVVGGGPAGMEAARVAALRGHKVTLWEKEEVLGGNLIPASVPDFKVEYRRLLEYLVTQIKKRGVVIELGKEATPSLVKQMNPDVVFLATGATPIIPEIPGIGNEKVVTAVDLLLGKKEAGESVVILGGGFAGSEAALYLANQGKKVAVVEILDTIASTMYSANRWHLLKLLDEANVEIFAHTTASEITDEGMIIKDKDGEEITLKADTIAVAVGLKSQDGPWEALHDSIPEVYPVGDYAEPRLVINAIWEGFRRARLI